MPDQARTPEQCAADLDRPGGSRSRAQDSAKRTPVGAKRGLLPAIPFSRLCKSESLSLSLDSVKSSRFVEFLILVLGIDS